MGQVERVRKTRGKQLAKRANMLAAGLQHNVGREKTLSIISENEELRKRLPFEKHLILYNEAMKL